MDYFWRCCRVAIHLVGELMAATYAGAKGRTPTVAGAPVARAVAPRPLSDAERAQVAQNKAFVEEHMPELIPFVKELYELGLIDGYRAIKNCKLLENDHGNA